MADLYLPSTLPPLFAGLPRQLEIDAATVGEALDRLEERWPGLRDRLCEPGPALRRAHPRLRRPRARDARHRARGALARRRDRRDQRRLSGRETPRAGLYRPPNALHWKVMERPFVAAATSLAFKAALCSRPRPR